MQKRNTHTPTHTKNDTKVCERSTTRKLKTIGVELSEQQGTPVVIRTSQEVKLLASMERQRRESTYYHSCVHAPPSQSLFPCITVTINRDTPCVVTSSQSGSPRHNPPPPPSPTSSPLPCPPKRGQQMTDLACIVPYTRGKQQDSTLKSSCRPAVPAWCFPARGRSC